MKKNKLPKSITLLVLTLLTSLLWISLNIYRSLTVKPPAVIANDISKSLNPNLDMEIINNIDKSIYIPDSEIPSLNVEFKIGMTPVPMTTPEPIIEATQSASSAAQI